MSSGVRVAGAFGAAGLSLSACATLPRMYSDQELFEAGRGCGLAPGSLLQDESEPRLLILFVNGVSADGEACVKSWSRKHGLRLALVEIKEKSQ